MINEFIYSFLVFRFSKFERYFPLQALAFRGRSGSLLGAFAPAVSPVDSLSRRSLVHPLQSTKTPQSDRITFTYILYSFQCRLGFPW